MAERPSEYIVELIINEHLSGDMYRAVFRIGAVADRLQAGQFINLLVPGDRSHILRTPLSFSAVDTLSQELEIVYACVGPATQRLSVLLPGAELKMTAPCGNAWPACDDCDHVALVSGGVGVTPIVAAARMLRAKHPALKITAFIGGRTESQLWGAHILEELNVEVVETTDDGSRGVKGTAVAAFETYADTTSYDRVLTCGPEVMMKALVRACESRSIECFVSMERMMSCAFGACSTCNVARAEGGYWLVCRKGPVFNAKDLLWE